ncbi:hypothetical protein ABFS82_08G056800 [Erythranthe guttata]|uniref:uncharacterized protein LOC105975740 n=1 Tax=Erythranthe guttata TaxID=4155 RepID=UPI00064D9DCB|nr:PREDICTED: uncharacterized protein LOC105975740 [Erythranthe guttata]|eukprot:XP_012856420.1 PREDICTED: uncharacterized protein LOC105975740 [Erythranthe guttata]
MMNMDRHFPLRIDTIELKHRIEMGVGHKKSEKYFNLLNRYLNLQLSKSEFDKLCIVLLGRDNVSLHNKLVRAIIKNAIIRKPQSSLNVAKLTNGYRNSLQFLHADVFFPPSPKKRRTHKPKKNPDKEREEVSGTSCIRIRRSPIRAPLGVCLHARGKQRKSLPSIDNSNTCYYKAELPDQASCLRRRVERRLGAESLLNVSTDCVDLLNNGLDAFMKRLLKPCLDLADLRAAINEVGPVVCGQRSYVSMTDFRVAMQLNPWMLGCDWPVCLEKVLLEDFDCD